LRSRLLLVAALFLTSGTTGLVYEIAFAKSLSPVFGATAYAVSAVLAAFMAGLALGAHTGGKLAGRVARPLAVYGVAEIGVGALCAVTPWAFQGIEIAYVALARGLGWIARSVDRGPHRPRLRRHRRADLLHGRHAATPREGHLGGSPRAGGCRGCTRSTRLGGAAGIACSAPTRCCRCSGSRGAMRAAAVVNVALGVGAIALGMRAAWPRS
jgi:spermidine synthase